MLTYYARHRTAFAVGGLHTGADAATDLTAFRERLQRARFRRVLLFPVARAELDVVEAAGFDTLRVGAEALLDPNEFTRGGSTMANLRSMCSRAARAGVRVAEVSPEAHGAELTAVYTAWTQRLSTKRSMRLLVGTPQLTHPFGRRYFLARHETGARPVAFVTVTPAWRGAGWGVDVMARRPDAPAGSMELLLACTLERLISEGSRHLSLGACPMLRPPGLPREAGWLPRFFDILYRSGWSNRLFPFEGLAHFKSKFDPTWAPIHIAAWPRLGAWALYLGCLMWGLFDRAP